MRFRSENIHRVIIDLEEHSQGPELKEWVSVTSKVDTVEAARRCCAQHIDGDRRGSPERFVVVRGALAQVAQREGFVRCPGTVRRKSALRNPP